MKNKKKVEAAVAMCTAGLYIPEGSSVDAEIQNIGWLLGIQYRDEMKSFVKNVKYNWQMKRCGTKKELEESQRNSIKWHRLLLVSVIITAIFFALFNTTFVTVEQPRTSERYYRICLILHRSVYPDNYSVQISPGN